MWRQQGVKTWTEAFSHSGEFMKFLLTARQDDVGRGLGSPQSQSVSLSLSLSLSRSSPRLSAVVRWAPCRQDVTGLALTSSQATPHRYWLATCWANCLFRKLSTMISIWISDMSGPGNWNRWRWPKSCWLLMFPSSSCCVWMTENKIKSWIDISWCQSRHYRHLVTWWVKINY